MSVNWEFAPSDAEKYNLANGYYYKGVRPNLFVHIDGDWTDSALMAKNEQFVYRPVQPKPWSGPEDGLPPIGMTVQVWDKEPHKCYAHHCGKSVEILAHRIGGYGDPVAVYCVKIDDGTDDYHALVEDCFRPIQPLQDARETAIRELMDIAQVDCRVTAARLVDAGFKREVV